MPKRYDQACPVAKSLELVGDRWTLLIVRDLLQGACRFQDFQASLKGIAPTVLSDRLKLMEEHGLVERRFYSDHPPRAEYLLTDKGRELGVVVGPWPSGDHATCIATRHWSMPIVGTRCRWDTIARTVTSAYVALPYRCDRGKLPPGVYRT